jgi:hypothetical protein
MVAALRLALRIGAPADAALARLDIRRQKND